MVHLPKSWEECLFAGDGFKSVDGSGMAAD